MIGTRKPSRTQLTDLDPELALLGALLQQTVKDATQRANAKLRAEAWEFLEVCAPTVADRLREKMVGG